MQEKQETWVQSLDQEDLWSRKWQLCLVFLPGKFHRQRRLAGYSPWGHKELDMTEWLHFHFGAQENLGDYNLFLTNNKLGQEKDFVTRKVPHGPTCFHFQVTIARSVTQSCPTLCDPTDCSLPGSSVQARILEWIAISFFRGLRG